MARKKQCNKCEQGFKKSDLGEIRRCMYCNPPIMDFGVVMEPVENAEEWTQGELQDAFCTSMAELLSAAIQYHDKQELAERR